VVSGLNAPELQSLGTWSAKVNPKAYGANAALGKEATQVELNRVAGGNTAEEQRAAFENTKANLSGLTAPMRETELGAANTAGKLAGPLQEEADRLAGLAENKVGDVRRFVAASERTPGAIEGQAGTAADVHHRMGFSQYLRNLADEVASGAASDSLIAGQGARFKQMQLDSLAAHGLTPIDEKPILSAIDGFLNNPAVGPEGTTAKALTAIKNKIREWTIRGDGVIDANALYAIRKNGITQVVQELLPNADASAQAKLASSILNKIKGPLDEAIIKAGGTGWKDYLSSFASGMNQVDKARMASELAQLHESNPTAFADIVLGKNPKVVEDIFGPGKFKFTEQMGDSATPFLKAASKVRQAESMASQAETGAKGLQDIIAEHTPAYRLPNLMNQGVATLNNAIGMTEKYLSKSTKQALSRAMQSGGNVLEVLNTIPTADRNRILLAMRQSSGIAPYVGSTIGRVVGAPAPQQGLLTGNE